jgi:hypothetical protein
MISSQNLKRALRNRDDLALVIGNGINRFKGAGQSSSWNDLLRDLWFKVYGTSMEVIPQGISLTEFYDLLELESTAKKLDINLQQEFCDALSGWLHGAHHERIMAFARARKFPVLTTNFDLLLARASEAAFHRFKREPFTDFYPWGCYYSPYELKTPESGFGIWHINGMERYHRSIRLGLTHYMGSVERARRRIHGGDEAALFSGKKRSTWAGRYTWLHIIFNTALFIFGLELEVSEVLLRWLLIERARYFKRFPAREKPGWYVCLREARNEGKELFLQKLGFTYVTVDRYEEIYLDLWD